MVETKQIELQASARNSAATSCFSIEEATPIAGYLYNVGDLQASLSIAILLIGGTGWLAAAVGLHPLARQVLKRLLP